MDCKLKIYGEGIMSHNFPCSPQVLQLINPTCCIGKTILGWMYAWKTLHGLVVAGSLQSLCECLVSLVLRGIKALQELFRHECTAHNFLWGSSQNSCKVLASDFGISVSATLHSTTNTFHLHNFLWSWRAWWSLAGNPYDHNVVTQYAI